MIRNLLVILVAIAFVSCEKKISKDNYDYLYRQYEEKCQNIRILTTDCEQLEKNIDLLHQKQEQLEEDVNRLDDKIEEAINSAEECEDYFRDMHRNNGEGYQYLWGETLILKIEDCIDECEVTYSSYELFH